MRTKASIIDAHCHIGQGYAMTQTAEELLRQMDECGVEKAVICSAEPQIAVYNREGNDFLLAAAKDHPDRFIPFAACNPWFGARAVEELRRCFREGCRGLKLHPPLQGFSLAQEIVYPLLEVCREFSAPAYFHTGTLLCSEPFQLLELSRRFPDVNFIMGHMGATDYWYDGVPAAAKTQNIYLETSAAAVIGSVTRSLKELGAGRILFGSDSPIFRLKLELTKIQRTGFSPDELGAILGGNLERLLSAAKA